MVLCRLTTHPTNTTQDWRYYHEALSAEEVRSRFTRVCTFGCCLPAPPLVLVPSFDYHSHLCSFPIPLALDRKLAFESVDEDGNNMRSCVTIQEGIDTDWTDPVGNGCAWYQEMRTTVPNICSTEEIRSKCPVACATKDPCFVGDDVRTSTYSIWNRIMHLREERLGDGVICVREGVDAAAECRKNLDVTTATPSHGGKVWPMFPPPAGLHGHRDINITDCDILKSRINPYCSFPAPWTKDVKAEIKRNGGFSMEFWFKAFETTKIPNTFTKPSDDPETMKRMLFFSSMRPPTVLARIDFSQEKPAAVQVFSTCGDNLEDINFIPPKGFRLETGVWYRTAFSWGAPNDEGKVDQSLYAQIIFCLS